MSSKHYKKLVLENLTEKLYIRGRKLAEITISATLSKKAIININKFEEVKLINLIFHRKHFRQMFQVINKKTKIKKLEIYLENEQNWMDEQGKPQSFMGKSPPIAMARLASSIAKLQEFNIHIVAQNTEMYNILNQKLKEIANTKAHNLQKLLIHINTTQTWCSKAMADVDLQPIKGIQSVIHINLIECFKCNTLRYPASMFEGPSGCLKECRKSLYSKTETLSEAKDNKIIVTANMLSGFKNERKFRPDIVASTKRIQRKLCS